MVVTPYDVRTVLNVEVPRIRTPTTNESHWFADDDDAAMIGFIVRCAWFGITIDEVQFQITYGNTRVIIDVIARRGDGIRIHDVQAIDEAFGTLVGQVGEAFADVNELIGDVSCVYLFAVVFTVVFDLLLPTCTHGVDIVDDILSNVHS
jgi:hypothetical protein